MIQVENTCGTKISEYTPNGEQITNAYGLLFKECSKAVEVDSERLIKDVEDEFNDIELSKLFFIIKYIKNNNCLFRESNGKTVPVDEKYLLENIFKYKSSRGKEYLNKLYEQRILKKIRYNKTEFIMVNPLYFRINMKKPDSKNTSFKKVHTVNRIPKMTAYVFRDDIYTDLMNKQRLDNFCEYINEIENDIKPEILK